MTNAGIGRGQWGGFDVLPLHMPVIADQGRQTQAPMLAPTNTHLLPDRPAPSLTPPHQHRFADDPLKPTMPAIGHLNDKAVFSLHGDAAHQDQQPQQDHSALDHQQLQSKPDAPPGVCPPIQFGVFTNLATGGKFAAPSNLSAAAQQAMRSFNHDDSAAPLMTFNSVAQPATQQAVKHAGEARSDVGGSDAGACPQVQFGVFTNLNTGKTFAAPKLSLAAQPRVRDLFSEDPLGPPDAAPVTLLPQPQLQSSKATEHAEADTDTLANVASEGACLQVPFGVFTDLKTDGSFAAPGELSAAAKQKAKNVLPELTDMLDEDAAHGTSKLAKHSADQHRANDTHTMQLHHSSTAADLSGEASISV